MPFAPPLPASVVPFLKKAPLSNESPAFAVKSILFVVLFPKSVTSCNVPTAPLPDGMFTSTTPGDVSDAVTPSPVKFNVVATGVTSMPSSSTTIAPPPAPIALNGSAGVPLPIIVTPSTATSVKQGVQGCKSGSGMSPVAQVS